MELQDEMMEIPESELPEEEIQEPQEEVEEKSDPMEEETPEYQPNYKYKVGDEEREFDERARGYVTDKESEDYFRDLFSKAHGLDVHKARSLEKERSWNEERSQHQNLQSQFTQVKTSLEQINGLKTEDFGTFQKIWEIPDSQILQRASEIVKILNDPAAQAAEARMYADRINNMQHQQQMGQQSQVQAQMHRQMHDMKMSTAMGNPEIQKFASEYDRRVGIPGAFQEEVNRIGSAAYGLGRYLDPTVAVGQAHERLSKLMGSFAPPPVPEGKKEVEAEGQKKSRERSPLPNLGSGRTGTSVGKKLKSIQDLRKLANSMG